jgi:hypothetical protein
MVGQTKGLRPRILQVLQRRGGLQIVTHRHPIRLKQTLMTPHWLLLSVRDDLEARHLLPLIFDFEHLRNRSLISKHSLLIDLGSLPPNL